MNESSGLEKLNSVRPHKAHIWNLAWSPTSDVLASGSGDQTVNLWDSQSGRNICTLRKHDTPVTSIAWSPDGRHLASTSRDGSILIMDAHTLKVANQTDRFLRKGQHAVSILTWSPDNQSLAFSQRESREVLLLSSKSLEPVSTINLGSAGVNCFAWSPDSHFLSIGSTDNSIYVWDMRQNRLRSVLRGHYGAVFSLSWSGANNLLASASSDETVRIWDPVRARAVAILEGHTNLVFDVQFSPSGNLLVSRSQDDTYRIWRVRTWDVVSTINAIAYLPIGGIAFHPLASMIAIKNVRDSEIAIWRFHEDELVRQQASSDSTHYVNARVVLTGDTGVGKSALSLVMTGKPFAPTESTHSRRVWTLDSYQIDLPTRGTETRETLLWDLAGQPGYRLIHQLYLTEVAVALVVFDARSETDPFSGVRHWERALRHAQSISNMAFPMKKLLVAARCDRGNLPVSRARIDSVVNQMDYIGFIETSAKEGIGVTSLLTAIKTAIDWEQLPKVSSNQLFQSIKQFIFYEKQSGRVIANVDDLFNSYLNSDYIIDSYQNPKDEFETCISLVESRGLIQRLSFGGLILLQPELLDAYASSMIEAAKQEPDGLGSIKEIDAREGRFFVPTEIRLKDEHQEQLLCIATVENLIRHELAIRQDSNSGTFLVFPTQFTRNWDEAPNPTGETIKYVFEGPVYNIYARLAVRLSHSGVFKRLDMWRNACSFHPVSGKGTCGVHLNASDEGRATLSLFYSPDSSAETRSQLDEFVSLHLKRHALVETIEKQLILDCAECGERFPPKAVQIRLEKGLTWIRCSVCDNKMRIKYDLYGMRDWQPAVVDRMDQAADRKREQAAAISVLQGKRQTQDFDVFISYNSRHRSEVLTIADKLKSQAILPWVDVWELRPGVPWQKNIERIIDNISSAAIMIGPHPLTARQKEHLDYLRLEKTPAKEIQKVHREMEQDNLKLGPWQDLETEALTREFVKRGCPVIPVILSHVKGDPKVPGFLGSMTFVDFRRSDPDPLQMLIFGITGRKSLPVI